MADPMMSLDEAGHPPLRISWSGLKEFETCPQKSWAKRQPGYVRPKVDGRMFLHGTLADRAMRKWLEQDTPHLQGQMSAYVDELWDEHAEKSEEYKIVWKGDPVEDRAKVRAFAKLVVNNVEPFLFARVLPHEYQPELRFRVPMKIPDLNGYARTIYLVGGMDIAVRHLPERDVVWLYDLKATADDNYINTLLPQLIFYKIAWHLRMGTPYEKINCAYLVPAATSQYRPITDTAEDRSFLLSRIVKMAHGVWLERNEVTEDEVCWNCEVKHICPRWNRPVHIDSRGKMRMPF